MILTSGTSGLAPLQSTCIELNAHICMLMMASSMYSHELMMLCSSISNTAALAVANAIADNGCGKVQGILTSTFTLTKDHASELPIFGLLLPSCPGAFLSEQLQHLDMSERPASKVLS